MPDPVEFMFPRWTRDPLFRGSFTNWGAGATVKQQMDMRKPIGGQLENEKSLWFNGEHTSRRFFGYLHGSYWEGRMAAAEVADCLLRGCRESSGAKKIKRDAEDQGDIASRSMGIGRSGRPRMWT